MERAAEMLRARFVFVRFSRPVYTEPVGCLSPDLFLNQVALLYSDESAERIKESLKEMERRLGRKPEDKARGRVPIDIDLLRWNDRVLKADDLARSYVRDGIRSLLAAGEEDEWGQ